MRSDLWDTTEWPSPSPEAVVRERVLGRARTIGRKRLAPVLACAVLAFGVVVQQLPSTQSSASLWAGTEDSEESPEGEETEATPSTSTTAPPSTTSTTSRSSGFDGVEVNQGPVQERILKDGPPPAISARENNDPFVTDPSGDADYRGYCSGTCLVESRRSQPALDLLSGDVRCTARDLVVHTTVLDADSTPDPNKDGEPVSTLEYLGYVSFNENRPDHSLVTTQVARSLPDGSLTVEATLSTYSKSSTFPEFTPIAAVQATIERDVVVVRIPWHALEASFDAGAPGSSPPAKGTSVRLTADSRPTFQTSWGPSRHMTTDSMSSAKFYALCD